MAQLWGGRFTKATEQKVYDFNASITFDKNLLTEDIDGSIAHVVMLEKQGILSLEEKDAIVKGLSEIRQDVESGKLEITSEYEDVHSFVEAKLIDRIGDAGKKMHTGRSRNDQVALDMRMHVRSEVTNVSSDIVELLNTLMSIMENNLDTYMPGFTHLQKAQPTTLAHHMGAYFEMFKRDYLRLQDIYKRMNYCPLGAGAFAGTTYPLDRNYTASLLGFEDATLNSMDSVADRDYCIELFDEMGALKRCGFKIMMDDFGSGYSSLNMLRNAPVDTLKIDRFFLDEIMSTERGKIIVESSVRMAKQLGLAVIAEGVETKDQLDFLESIDCDTVQGYYYSRPVPIEEYETFMERYR